MSFETVWNFIREKTGLSIAIAVGVVLLIVGLVNYIKAFKSVSTGEETTKKTLPMPKPTAPKPVKVKTKRVLPVPILTIGILLSFTSFFLRLADLKYGFRLSEYLALDSLWNGLSAEELEYEFEMLVFVINSALATILLFITFYRQSRKNGWGFWKTVLVYYFTYNFATQLLYSLCLAMGKLFFTSADSGPMLYTWFVYLYLIIWVLIDKSKDKNAATV